VPQIFIEGYFRYGECYSIGTLMAARLLFGASNKSEGDLLKVEVDLLSSTEGLATCKVGKARWATTSGAIRH
jgi:hypothetical protein